LGDFLRKNGLFAPILCEYHIIQFCFLTVLIGGGFPIKAKFGRGLRLRHEETR
jgi:hypothetical protein